MFYKDMSLEELARTELENRMGDDAGLVVYVTHLYDDVFNVVIDGNESFHVGDVFHNMRDAGLEPRNHEWLSPAECGEPIETEADFIPDWHVELTISNLDNM